MSNWRNTIFYLALGRAKSIFILSAFHNTPTFTFIIIIIYLY